MCERLYQKLESVCDLILLKHAQAELEQAMDEANEGLSD